LVLGCIRRSGRSRLGFQGRACLDGWRALLSGRRLSGGIRTQAKRDCQACNQYHVLHEISPDFATIKKILKPDWLLLKDHRRAADSLRLEGDSHLDAVFPA
jgi:hypothetical protein